ncbi:glutaredoxin family protein [bacterium]|nr:glutaredoxin family protein [bacterium]
MKWYVIGGCAALIVLSVLFLILRVNTAETIDPSKTMYAWKDKDGKVYVTNSEPPHDGSLIRMIKPAGERAENRQIEEPRPVQPTAIPTVTLANPQDHDERVTPAKVELYSTTWCIYCRKARQFFKDNNVNFVEYDIEKSSEGQTKYRQLRGQGVPLIVVGTEVVHGFNEARLRELLKL